MIKISRDSESFGRPCWIAVYGGCWLHIEDTLPKLLWSVLTKWKSDLHIVGY